MQDAMDLLEEVAVSLRRSQKERRHRRCIGDERGRRHRPPSRRPSNPRHVRAATQGSGKTVCRALRRCASSPGASHFRLSWSAASGGRATRSSSSRRFSRSSGRHRLPPSGWSGRSPAFLDSGTRAGSIRSGACTYDLARAVGEWGCSWPRSLLPRRLRRRGVRRSGRSAVAGAGRRRSRRGSRWAGWPECLDAVVRRRRRARRPSRWCWSRCARLTILAVVAASRAAAAARFGRWALALGVGRRDAARVRRRRRAPDLAAAARRLLVAAAASVRLASPARRRGMPEPDDVRADLAVGVAATRVEPAARQTAGVFLVRAEARAGRALLVKVYGRDAYDSQLVAKLWRRSGTRAAAPLRLCRLQAVEHEAFVTLLAQQRRRADPRGRYGRPRPSAGRRAARARGVAHRARVRRPARRARSRGRGRRSSGSTRRHRAPADRPDGRRSRRGAGLLDFARRDGRPGTDQLETDRAQLLVDDRRARGHESRARGGAALGPDGWRRCCRTCRPPPSAPRCARG